MKLARPRRRETAETIIALIDVAFFLLVFFLLIGRMDATAPFEVAPPEAAAGSDMPGGGVTVAVSADGAVALSGTVVDREAVVERVAAALAEDPQILVRINAHRKARLRDVLSLTGEIEALGAREVVLVITPPS